MLQQETRGPATHFQSIKLIKKEKWGRKVNKLGATGGLHLGACIGFQRKKEQACEGQTETEVQVRLCLLFDKASLITSACCAIALALLQLCGVPLQISRLWRGPAPSLQNALVRHSEPHTA